MDSSMSSMTTMGAMGKKSKRSRNWTTRETNLLIELWKHHMQDLKASGERRKRAITTIENAFHDGGYSRNAEQIRKKMENLVEMYKTCKSKSGSSSPVLWEHFDILDLLFNSEEYLSPVEKVETVETFQSVDGTNHRASLRTPGVAKRARKMRKLVDEIETESLNMADELRMLRAAIEKGFEQINVRMDNLETSIHQRQDALENKVLSSLGYGAGFQHWSGEYSALPILSHPEADIHIAKLYSVIYTTAFLILS